MSIVKYRESHYVRVLDMYDINLKAASFKILERKKQESLPRILVTFFPFQ